MRYAINQQDVLCVDVVLRSVRILIFGKDFAGAIAPVNAYRILNEEQDTSHHEQIAEKYRKHYFEGCGKSLSCQNICPAGIPVEELMVRSNAAAVWKK